MTHPTTLESTEKLRMLLEIMEVSLSEHPQEIRENMIMAIKIQALTTALATIGGALHTVNHHTDDPNVCVRGGCHHIRELLKVVGDPDVTLPPLSRHN